jgi:adenine-specific DNA-methyltransferase
MNLLLRGLPTLKELGAFYTPESTAASLARWAIRSGRERILEPSIGGGALLRAVLSHASELSETHQIRAVACDIDRAAIAILRSQLGGFVEFIEGDFLNLSPLNCGKFDVVIANPPFTRNHSLGRRRSKALRRRFSIEGPAGLWVHFLVHAMEFLKEGGRLASIAPGSSLFTKYGDALMHRLCGRFSDVNLFQLEDKPLWGGGADERGAIILADGYGLGPVSSYGKKIWRLNESLRESPAASMPTAYQRLFAKADELSKIAQLSIGLVTGCNRVFLLSESERQQLGLRSSWVKPTITRARQIRGLTVSRQDLLDLAEKGEKTWLLSPRELSGRNNPARQRLSQLTKAKRNSTAWFKKRTPWWKVDLGPPCDAVFTYMNDRGPRLALVDRGIFCTNTLHRVIFRSTALKSQKIGALLTLLTTFGQLAAEQIGRVYGGGVLKFELSDARKIPVLRATATLTTQRLGKLDDLLRAGRHKEATNLADELLLKDILGKTWKADVAELGAELTRRRVARQTGKAILR